MDLIHELFLNGFEVSIRQNCGVPRGSRTPVIAVKGRCPRPLDDGDHEQLVYLLTYLDNQNGVPRGSRTPVIAVKGRCPRPLDDGDNTRNNHRKADGGAKRDRTADLLHAMQALSQLSYSPF